MGQSSKSNICASALHSQVFRSINAKMVTDNSDCASTSANLVRKHKAKSPAWDYFGLRVDLEGRVVKSTADQPVCACWKQQKVG